MSSVVPFVSRRPVTLYYALTFLISWGGILLAAGRGLFSRSSWQEDPLFPLAVLAMLAGPPAAAVISAALESGREGLRRLFSGLLVWRVPATWLALALLVAPLLECATLGLLSLSSPVFLPRIFTTPDRTSLVFQAVSVGLLGGFVEELGWTGFVIPRLLKRSQPFAVGLLVGVLWGAWHLLQM